MNRAEMLEKITGIFREVFDDDSLVITEATHAADIEDWDSLAQITLVTAVEDMFGMQFLLEDVTTMQNVGEMMDIIERELAAK